MTDSDLAHTFDKLQARLDPMLRQFGFRKHGRTYNRPTPEDLTQVIGFQMGRFDPLPGAMHIPGLRENLYGKFTVNLGIYVPEVARNHGGGEAKSVVQDGNCCIRTRLGRKADKELWWKISDSEGLVAEISERLQNEAFHYSGASRLEIRFSMSFERAREQNSWRYRGSFAPSSWYIAANERKRDAFCRRRLATTHAIPAIPLT